MNVQYSEISTREVVTICDLVERAWSYSIKKAINAVIKSL